MNAMSRFETFISGLFTSKPEPRVTMRDIHGTKITITTEGTRVLFWREFAAHPFLEMDVDMAYMMALDCELAVESIDG